jgi:hypothetical protein
MVVGAYLVFQNVAHKMETAYLVFQNVTHKMETAYLVFQNVTHKMEAAYLVFQNVDIEVGGGLVLLALMFEMFHQRGHAEGVQVCVHFLVTCVPGKDIQCIETMETWTFTDSVELKLTLTVLPVVC